MSSTMNETTLRKLLKRYEEERVAAEIDYFSADDSSGAELDAMQRMGRLDGQIENLREVIARLVARPDDMVPLLASSQADYNASASASSAERMPETVLRAMLKAYEVALLNAHVAYMNGERSFDAARVVDRLSADVTAVRGACAWVIAGNADVDLREHRRDDYEARLRGERPLDAPPLETP